MNRLHRYCGARSLSDLKTIVLDSLPMSSSMVFQPNSTISGLLGVSKLLFVMILAARFWNLVLQTMRFDTVHTLVNRYGMPDFALVIQMETATKNSQTKGAKQ